MPQSIEQVGRRGWRFGAHIYRTEAAAHAALTAAIEAEAAAAVVERRQRLRKRAVLAAILGHRSIADAIVRARTTGRV